MYTFKMNQKIVITEVNRKRVFVYWRPEEISNYGKKHEIYKVGRNYMQT